MRRKILTLFLALALVISCSGISNAMTEKDILIYIDGVRLVAAHSPAIENGQMLVPAEEFFKAMGAKLTIEESLFDVVAVKGLIEERLDYKFKSFEINRIQKDITTGAAWVDEIFYVPIRAAAEGFFATVEWKDGSIYVTTNKTGYAEYPGVPDFGKLYNCQEKPIKISESETKTPIGTLNGKTITKLSHESTFFHTYNSVNASPENVGKYKEELKKCGYEFYTSRDNETVKSEFYKKADGSMVGVASAKNKLCIISITVPVSLDSLGLKATN